MAKDIINDALHDVRGLAKLSFDGIELTLQQSREFDSNLRVINEFAAFISQTPNALSEQDKRDTIKQLSGVYDELVAYGLQTKDVKTRALLSNATNSIFNLNSALANSIEQINPTSSTQPQTTDINGLELGVEIAKFGLGASFYAVAATAGALAVAGRKGMEWTQDMFNKSFRNTPYSASDIDVTNVQNIQKETGTGLVLSKGDLVEPRMPLSSHLAKQNEINYLGSTSQLGDKMALIEHLGSSDDNSHEKLKERTVESLLSDIDRFEKNANALSPDSKERMRAMNELISSSLDDFDLKSDSFKGKLGDSLKSAFEKIKTIIRKALNLGMDDTKGLSN